MSQEIVLKSFDKVTRTLVVVWSVELDFSDEPKVSDEFGYHEMSGIKWYLELNEPKIYLCPVSKRNSQYLYTVSMNALVDHHTKSPMVNNVEYDGTKRNFCFKGYPWELVNDISIILTLVYPEEAMKEFLPLTVTLPKIDGYFRSLFCDVKFKIGEDIIEAHKIILAKRSDVFHKMFTSDLNDPTQASVIEIKDEGITPSGLRAFLDTIYEQKVPSEVDICLEIIQLAEKYKLQDVKCAVESRILSCVSEGTAVRLLIAGDMFGADKLKSTAMDFMITHQDMKSLPDAKKLCQNYPHLIFDIIEKIQKN